MSVELLAHNKISFCAFYALRLWFGMVVEVGNYFCTELECICQEGNVLTEARVEHVTE